MVTFTVIVPTVGRPTLKHTLESVADQLRPGDELIVLCNDDGDWGDAARNSAVERARGTHLVFLDDDDEWTPNALATMRDFAERNPGRVGIFRMSFDLWPTRWQSRTIADTASCMYVVPNIPGKVGVWQPHPERGPHWDDAQFISHTLELQGTEPLWCTEITTRTRPERRRLRRLRYRLRLRSRLRAFLAAIRRTRSSAR